MSSGRQIALRTGAVVVSAITLGDGDGFDQHDHPTHQLAWASTGVLTLQVGASAWVLPRSRALWIPAGVPHQVLAAGRTRFLCLYFDPATCPITYAAPTVIDTAGLLGHLIDHLVLPLDGKARSRAELVLFDLVEPMEVSSLHVPMPSDERARRMADALRRDPADARTLQQWGREVGASGRTLARIVEAETGLGFAAWRTQLRMAAALPLLAAGTPVGRVAGQVGYATPSAFVAAFRRAVGMPPGAYLASDR